jgi:N-methylhydantoinase B
MALNHARLEADPVRTEVIRNALNSAAAQMGRALHRTAFSPIIYEARDYAVALYDDEVRLLAQAPSLPLFLGTMSFCVEAAVAAVGGQNALENGDVILLNDPYATGSHPQDGAVVMPVFLPDGLLVGYGAIKAHWLDIGGKDPYTTDSHDVLQEGTIFPGVKLYRAGELVPEIMSIVTANSRIPIAARGDLHAQVVGARIGAAALVRIVERFGLEVFRKSVEAIFAHSEAKVRAYVESIPDGRYVGHGVMDSNGNADDPIPFEVAVEISAGDIHIDLSDAPPQQTGPVNSPLASSVSACRVALSALAGAGEAPTEGQFRPLTVETTSGSLFHPTFPAPCAQYYLVGLQLIEAIYHAIGRVMPERVPAGSGGDILAVVWWGLRAADGRPWADGFPLPVGHGGSQLGDGAGAMMHLGSLGRTSPVEILETRNPWLIERWQLANDTCGAGRHRGGLGYCLVVRALEDLWITTSIERTTNGAAGLAGGSTGAPNRARLTYPGGEIQALSKNTRVFVPEGSRVEIQSGGGGGHGPAHERAAEAVLHDVLEEYVSEANAREAYPHAFGA